MNWSLAQVVNVLAYDAYGNLIASNGVLQTGYLYSGQQWDPDLGFYYNRARYLNTGTGRFWTMDTDEGDNEDPLSLHKYLYAQDDPVDNTDPSGNDYGSFDINLSTIFLPFLKTPMLADSIINATGGSALNPTGLPVKTLNDADIDGQLNSVYGKIRLWEKQSGFGPVPKETWSQFKRMMASSTVDTIWRGPSAKGYLYQYNGTEHPLLLNKTFINSDINYLGFGEGYCARGILGLHEAIREHLWVDYNSSYLFGIPVGIGKRPSPNTFAAADTGYDWAEDKFWPSGGPRHGSGN